MKTKVRKLLELRFFKDAYLKGKTGPLSYLSRSDKMYQRLDKRNVWFFLRRIGKTGKGGAVRYCPGKEKSICILLLK